MNYDYRLIYLKFSLILLKVVFPAKHASRWFLAVQVGAFWSTVSFFGATGSIPVLFAVFGNACQLILAIYLLGAIYRVLEPSTMLKVPLVLAYAV